ncbi:MAG: bactoprenol glucosyl transferase [Pseudomonadota bacterium]|jgi:dolichol-phosphate mannosyltransferase
MLKEKVLSKLEDYELILVDDGSEDDSWSEMQKIRAQDNKVKLIRLSRNFGSITAQLAGLSYVSGDCATVIAADLQDPPEIILELLNKWKTGTKVCLAVRADREESFIQKTISNTFYKIMRKFALKNMPLGGFDCFLIDRQVVEVLKNIEEKNSSIVGQILWCGFKSEQISYVRKAREIGESRWTFSKKIKYFIDSILAFSYAPIRMTIVGGSLISLASFALILFLMFQRVFMSVPIRGWTSIICLILFTFGIQLIILGMIGEYLWRALDESRKRPAFIIDEKLGIDDEFTRV